MFRFAASSKPVNLRASQRLNLREAGLVALACSAMLLAGCGGGSRAKAYQPDRVVSFGDENSAIGSLDATATGDTYTGTLTDGSSSHVNLKGLTYTVNAVTTDSALVCANNTGSLTKCTTANAVTTPAFGTAATTEWRVVDTANYPNLVTKVERDTVNALQRTTDSGYFCTSNTIWVQAVAHNFGKGYKTACPIDYDGAQTYATYGAKVADVVAQIAAHRSELGSGVLVTIMAGQNDILEVFKVVLAGNMSEDSAKAALTDRAGQMATAVQDVISTGAKVVLALTPDLSESPYGYSSGNQALLATLTHLFNDTLYISKLGNTSGRDLAGVNPVSYTNTGTRSSSYVYSALCDLTLVKRPDGSTPVSTDGDYAARVKYCNTNTYVSSGSLSTYMWADDTHFAPLGHGLIGTAAATRAANQF